MEQKEFIICSAIHVDNNKQYPDQPMNINYGFVVTGRRHSDCYITIECLLKAVDKTHMINSIQLMAGKRNQGFITNRNRYIGRYEAYQIALEANQIIFGKSAIDENNKILISENLYEDFNYG